MVCSELAWRGEMLHPELSKRAARAICFQRGPWPLRLGGILQAPFANRKTQPGILCDYC